MIKLSSMNKPLDNKQMTTVKITNSLLKHEKPIVRPHKQDYTFSKQPVTAATKTSRASSSLLNTLVRISTSQPVLSTKKPDILLTRILNALKSGLRDQLTSGYYRLKSLCSNSYVSIRKNSVIANTSEDKAFSSKQCKNT